MPRVLPFQGVRYNPARIPDITGSPRRLRHDPARRAGCLYGRDPHNVVRLILGRQEENGRPVDRYANAAGCYRRWRSEGILTQDAAPSIYLYREDYTWPGASTSGSA